MSVLSFPPDGGSSPHTRGALRMPRPGHQRRRIIPAYAGSTGVCPWPRKPTRDHPRIRGEHHVAFYAGTGQIGSSPHTRGAPSRALLVTEPRGIIPAYAGSTDSRTGPRPAASDHPRIRGEHAPRVRVGDTAPGSSPHTRGAQPMADTPEEEDGIIPAYAGSTPSSPTKSQKRADHPRIRGEHGYPNACSGTLRGSSPHTRGAPRPSTTST